ncbi:MAG: heme exporter protein CcmB [Cytophagales bacterium]|nr:heme exporter protein CcmB [Cytophagales bacterium]MCA6369577.1 heme exporter protein CcmB [Cytophagales bacterium]MCA6370709.1 heme exporter protein CcmB [Cytophagales bacterium]MCA6377109.1 heme exporter protein CcmB [Cytophagales bacterium]MCA6383762.1 heme exporter protein CcmB [Cytophagales bacterium]
MEKIKELLKKEFTLELRRKSVFSGLALYVFSTVFVYYLTFNLRQNLISPLVWSALFWVTILFSSINTIAKSFIGEKRGQELYFYSLVSPESIVLSKLIYNFLLCVILALTGFGLFVLFLSNPIEILWTFIVTIFLTSWGFAASLTLLSGIASKANNSHIVMTVLSFPIVISILLLSIKITKNCIDGLEASTNYDELLTLVAINCLVTAASYLLFPYIWRT